MQFLDGALSWPDLRAFVLLYSLNGTVIILCSSVCAQVCVHGSVFNYLQGHTPDLRPGNWERLVLLGTKAVPYLEKAAFWCLWLRLGLGM